MALTTQSFIAKFRYDLTTKQITLTDTTDYIMDGVDPSKVKIVVKAETAAGGVFYNNTNYSLPDIDPNVSLDSVIVIPLPLDSGSNPANDDYTITVTWRDTTSGTDYYIKAETFTLDYSSPIVDISMTVDCLIPKLEATDNTNYTVGLINPIITRDFKIHYPPSLRKADVTGTGSILATNTFYTLADTTLEHSSSLESTLSYDYGIFFIEDIVYGSDVIAVSCSGDICDIFCCKNTLYERFISLKGVNNILANIELQKLLLVSALSELVYSAIRCGKGSLVSGYVSEILKIADCKSGCGCSDGTPQLVVGMGGGSNTLSVLAGTGIDVSLSGGDYTVSLNAENIAKLASTYNTVVSAGTNTSVSTSTVTVGNVTTKTYTVNATDTIIDSLFVRVAINFTLAGSPTYNISAKKNYGSVFTDTFTDLSGGTPLMEFVGVSDATTWMNNFADLKVQNFFSGSATDYFPEIHSITEYNRAKTLISVTPTSGQSKKFTPYIYITGADTLNFKFLDSTGSSVLGSTLNKSVSSIVLILKINA